LTALSQGALCTFAQCGPCRFSSTILSQKANLLSERYNYPACRCRQASLIKILKFYERPCIVPNEVMRLNVVARLSTSKSIFNPVIRFTLPSPACAGTPDRTALFFFISVQAMIRSSLPASPHLGADPFFPLPSPDLIRVIGHEILLVSENSSPPDTVREHLGSGLYC